MAGVKPTTLPNILCEYSSSYKQRQHSQRRPHKRALQDRMDDGTRTGGDTPDLPPALSRSNNRPPSPLLRASSFTNKTNQDKQRRERMFEFWQTLKEDVRDQESERLQEKITIQQELIRAQDEQHQKRERQRRLKYVQKRDEEKGKRNAKTEKLQEICRQSLSDDRKAAAYRKNAERKSKALKKSTNTTLTASGVSQDDRTDLSPPDTGSHLSLASSVLPLPSSGDPGQRDAGGVEVFMTLQEEQDEDVEYFSDGDDELLPWHHVQLYRLYGRNADYFLHPKIETEQKTTVQLNPRLRDIGGQAGAGVLWKVLRNESRLRLVHQDSKLLSPELKSAFGAFTREGLLKQRQPVRRNYNNGEDVPDLARLMDQSKVLHAQDFRHKVELMFRSSLINQDRTKVLLYNNPTPDLNNRDGDESIQRYVPSWTDSDQWDKESELSYKKWLGESRPRNGYGTSRKVIDANCGSNVSAGDKNSEPNVNAGDTNHGPNASAGDTNRGPNAITGDTNRGPSVIAGDTNRGPNAIAGDTNRGPNASAAIRTEDWKAILSSRTRRHDAEKAVLPKYIFLTEADATCPGQFSRQRKERADNRNVPRAYGERIPNKSASVISEVIGDGRDITSPSPRTDSHHTEPVVKSVHGLAADMSLELRTPWEPLSQNALEEYGERRDVLGQGGFNHGKVTVWSTAKT